MGREARLNAGRPRGGKVVLGYPVGGSVTLPFHVSCLRLLGYELAKPEHKRLLAQITHSSGLYVGDNRTLITERFDDRGSPEWLLQIDTDIEFPPTILETLLELAGSDKKLLAASVPLGAYPSCAFRRDPEKVGKWEAVHPVPLEPVEVDGIATACALIHRDVFDAIAEKNGACWWHHIYLPDSPAGTPPRRFRYLSQGEDLALSVRAAAHGFKVWAVHVPGLGHFKTRRCSHDDERAFAFAQHLDASNDGMGEIVEE